MTQLVVLTVQCLLTFLVGIATDFCHKFLDIVLEFLVVVLELGYLLLSSIQCIHVQGVLLFLNDLALLGIIIINEHILMLID